MEQGQEDTLTNTDAPTHKQNVIRTDPASHGRLNLNSCLPGLTFGNLVHFLGLRVEGKTLNSMGLGLLTKSHEPLKYTRCPVAQVSVETLM